MLPPRQVTGGETISIHAPVKGATKSLAEALGGLIISIHAPVKGATLDESSSFKNPQAFQSTHP